MWELDPATHQVLWDDRCRELFGLAKDNYLPYEQAIRSIHPEDQTRVNTAVQWAMNPQSGGLYDQTYRRLSADGGKLRWVRFYGQGYANEMSEIHRFAGVAQAVTPQVLIQQQIEDAQHQLLRQFEQAPVGIATLSGADLTFGMINQCGSQLVGRSPEELVGKPLLEALPELNGQGLQELLRQVIATGLTHRAPEVAVNRVRQARMETIYLDVTYQPHQQAGGNAASVMVITMDVTDQVHARRRVEESKAQPALFSNTVPAIIFYLDRQQRYQFCLFQLFVSSPAQNSVVQPLTCTAFVSAFGPKFILVILSKVTVVRGVLFILCVASIPLKTFLLNAHLAGQ